MKIIQLEVGMLQTNVYILSIPAKDGNDCNIIIDPGAEPEKILSELKKNNISEIKYILLTHNHWDHTGAVIPLKNKLKIKCGSHTLDKTECVDFLFNDGDVLDGLQVIHTPGHTTGGCCFFIPSVNPPILFAGDTIFPEGGYGRTDFGGNEKDIKKSIKDKILVLPPNTIIYPGHGPSTTVEQEQEYW
ncbi:MAG: MBL fold metallo-hydrolase [bacterium]|nr:MBL fold metallo-hydrolase [bacterium]